jgi:hypothetical protein
VCNVSRYKTNYDNVADGSMDNRKKRRQKKKNTHVEGEEEVNEKKNFGPRDMLPTCDRLLEASILQRWRCSAHDLAC